MLSIERSYIENEELTAERAVPRFITAFEDLALKAALSERANRLFLRVGQLGVVFDLEHAVDILGGVLLVVVVGGGLVLKRRLSEPGHRLGGVHHCRHFIVCDFI